MDQNELNKIKLPTAVCVVWEVRNWTSWNPRHGSEKSVSLQLIIAWLTLPRTQMWSFFSIQDSYRREFPLREHTSVL